MKAPSEKHLEDWIVNRFDRFGYQYLRDDDSPDDWTMVPFCAKLIRRQMRLPNGIADLITITGNANIIIPVSVCVVELKQGNIDSAVVAQCLRYMSDLKEVYSSRFYGMNASRTRKVFPPANSNIASYPATDYEPVTGMIVGHSFDDPNLPMICNCCNIMAITYDYEPSENDYTFNYHNIRPKGNWRDYDELSCGALGEAFEQALDVYCSSRNGWVAE